MADSTTAAPGGQDRDRETLAAAQGLTASLDAMAGRLKEVSSRLTVAEKTAQGNRRIIVGLIVSFCLDVAITAGFGYNTVRVDDAQNASHASEISACTQANANRTQDIAIWNSLLGDLAPAAARSAAARKELTVLRREVKVKDELRNCAALYAK